MRREWRYQRRGHREHAHSSLAGGLFLLGLGVLLLLDRTGLLDIRRILEFWPMVFVAAGLANLFRGYTVSGRVFSAVLVATGLVWTADNLGYLHLRGDLLWPFLLIGLGVLLLGRALESNTAPEGEAGAPADDPIAVEAGASRNGRIRASVVFSSIERRVTGQDFESARLEAVFGAVELDLRRAGMRGTEAVVKAAAVFGGIDVLVPEGWDVDLHGSSIFGAVSDQTVHPQPDSAAPPPRLMVKGATVFGAVTVANRKAEDR